MSRQGRGTTVGRGLVLLAGTAVAAVPVRALVEPPLRALASGRGLLPLDQLVVAGCAAALAACWLWLSACVWLVALRVLREGTGAARPARRVRGCPRLVHVLVLVALGVTATAPAHAVPAPAHAVPAPADSGRAGAPGAARGLVGLAVPDRVSASRPTPALVRVRPGDSLWRIARRLLDDGADRAGATDDATDDAAVDRMWRRLAAANADRIGPDPDLIFPGTLLRVPETGRALGKDDR